MKRQTLSHTKETEKRKQTNKHVFCQIKHRLCWKTNFSLVHLIAFLSFGTFEPESLNHIKSVKFSSLPIAFYYYFKNWDLFFISCIIVCTSAAQQKSFWFKYLRSLTDSFCTNNACLFQILCLFLRSNKCLDCFERCLSNYLYI